MTPKEFPAYDGILEMLATTPELVSEEVTDAFLTLMTAKPPNEFTAAEIVILEKHFPTEFKAYAEFHWGENL